ncbi:hypothetical protein G6F56_000313 [Rhizopus delemar]|nr:hypothetical protein G6F56_000313 [Rhizopus delemar]
MTQYIPTIFETAAKDMVVDSRNVVAELWDSAGQEDYDRLRTLSYPDSDVIVIAFSVDIPESLENITEKVTLYPALLRLTILVDTRMDLRQDKLPKQSEPLISYQQGMDVARQVGAYKYVECSAKLGQGVQQVFDTAIKSTMVTSSCVVM